MNKKNIVVPTADAVRAYRPFISEKRLFKRLRGVGEVEGFSIDDPFSPLTL